MGRIGVTVNSAVPMSASHYSGVENLITADGETNIALRNTKLKTKVVTPQQRLHFHKILEISFKYPLLVGYISLHLHHFPITMRLS